MLLVIGDVHGYTKSYQKWLHKNTGPDQSTVQIGDMGLGFSGVGLHPMGPNHTFFRGNHDDPKKCRDHKNYRGDFGYDPNTGVFHIAGAFSIDRAYRVEGESWWRDEELSYQELTTVLELYQKYKPRFVLSHEAPAKAAQTLLLSLIGPYFADKMESSMSRTSEAMQQMLDFHQPEEWIFGHYHVDKEVHVPHYTTKFRCVGGILSSGEKPHHYELQT